MDTIVIVVIVTLMKATILQFVGASFSLDEVRMSDSSLLKFYVGKVLVYLFSRNSQRGVLVIPPLHTSVEFISILERLLLILMNRLGLDGSKNVKVRLQLLL